MSFKIEPLLTNNEDHPVKAIFCLVVLALVSCASDEVLQVRQFHLRDTEVERDYNDRTNENQFIRGEINKRVHGAVTQEERDKRKGDYYTVSWKGLSGASPVQVTFEYRQATSGSRVKKIDQKLPAAVSGKTEFQIIGDDFLNKGRVTAWRMSLYDGSEKLATKTSYLWD